MSIRKLGKGYALAFFLFFLPVCYAQEAGTIDYPVITRLDSRDLSYRQYINDVENNRRLLFANRARSGTTAQTAENLTIYQYTPSQGEDLLFLAARCNVPYSALASLNRLNNPASFQTLKPLLLPSCPGIFLPARAESELEMLLGAGRLSSQEYAEIKINITGISETYFFFPGADFSPTERAFFLNSGFRFPLRNYRLTSDYGIRESPISGNIIMHNGIDLAAPAGTEVLAVADGIVTEIGFDSVYGNYIIISHGERWTSLYGHLQKIETVLRSAVKSGNLIGRVGSTGQSTGPHLHFELHQDGRALNPGNHLRNAN
ncbi:MAG: M23 family metallopeptidase [Treponema sp.]|nr:M23 family metallopeptidase [Treponema sp.]